jgi:hypothetical protein
VTQTQTISPTPSQTSSFTRTPSFTATPQVRYDLVVVIFNSSGQQIASLFSGQVAGPPSAPKVSHDTFAADGQTSLMVSSTAGDYVAYWDGMAADGYRAYPGAYTIQARYSEFGKNVIEVRNTGFTLIWPGTGLAQSMQLAPNPASAIPGSQVRLMWDVKPGFRIRARIYNLAGELVIAHAEDSLKGHMEWSLSTPSGQQVANGVYIWSIEVLDERGQRVEKALKKLVVLHK